MAEEDKDQKTEAPTSKRLEEARERGQVPISKETSMWISLAGVLMVMSLVAPSLAKNMSSYLGDFIGQSHSFSINEENIRPLFLDILGRMALIAGIPFAILIAAIIGGVMAQTGFFFSLDLLAPDPTRLMPSKGLQRLFSMNSVVELGKSLGKLLLMGLMAYSILKGIAFGALSFTGHSLEAMLEFLHKNLIYLIKMLLLVFTAIAAIDLFYTRFQYIRNLRMTKTEIKDEHKQQEGDPMIKSRLRQMRMERARKRMMAQIPQADVVITNPTHYAVALRYDAGKSAAPVVVAKGINLIAERIRSIAEENNVPLVSNPPLARALHDTVDVDQQIPTEHYRAVAEVISYVYKLKKRRT